MVAGGAALARDADGRVVFISGALPDELVTVQVRTAKKDFATADVDAVIEASPVRVVPACEAWHRGCGGCDWQHVDPVAQLALKTEIVREALTRTARVEQPVVTGAASVPPWGYRTTVRMAVDANGTVGFRSRRSHEVIAIRSCPVANSRINDVLQTLIVEGADEFTVRVGVAENVAAVWGEAGAGFDARGAGVRVGVHTSVRERVGGHDLRVSAGSFFQSSPDAAELLVAAVSRALSDIDLSECTVIDAYGGVGLFAVTTAAHARRVIVVEASPSSCADARHNLGGRRADVVESRLEAWQPQPADVVIADPARSGLDKVAAARLASTGAGRIVLVSCDPASLARDTRLLRDLGYAHRGTEVIDAFPNTSHIEAVTRFDRFVPLDEPLRTRNR